MRRRSRAKPVRIVTNFSAGSGPDVLIRVIADQLSKVWSQAVVVENRPGAIGIIAIDALAKSEPDGYTLGVPDSAVLTVTPHTYPSMKVQPERDIVPLSMWFNVPTAAMIRGWHASRCKQAATFISRHQDPLLHFP